MSTRSFRVIPDGRHVIIVEVIPRPGEDLPHEFIKRFDMTEAISLHEALGAVIATHVPPAGECYRVLQEADLAGAAQ